MSEFLIIIVVTLGFPPAHMKVQVPPGRCFQMAESIPPPPAVIEGRVLQAWSLTCSFERAKKPT